VDLNTDYKYLSYSLKGSVCCLLIDRQQYLNALSIKLIKELINFYNWVDSNNDIRVIIMTGAGNKSFVSGADIKEMSELDAIEAKEYSELGQSLTVIIKKLSKPVIAAINGYALGGGCELAMACHLRYASRIAKFGQPEVGLGLIAGFGGTQRLTRLVGEGFASELLFSGEIISSKKALEIGLINKILESREELLLECHVLADKISGNSPIAIQNTIKAINEGQAKNIDEALKIEAILFSKTFSSKDSKEGMSSFLKKKKPNFSGD